MNTIIVQPCGGLCNRMRTIVGAADLANRLGHKLIIVWTTDSTLNASFNSLFSSIPYKVIECSLTSIKFKLLFHWYKDILSYQMIDDEFIKKQCQEKISEWLGDFSKGNFYICGCENITLADDYSMFTINPLLEKYILPDFRSENTIGIHIRRSDNSMSIQNSPTSLFIENMKEEIRKNPQIMFYLATDDEEEEKQMKQQFGERMLIYKKETLDRNDPRGIRDAMLDLYHLAHCKKIYGSYFSSFSDIAALWGNIEKITLSINSSSK